MVEVQAPDNSAPAEHLPVLRQDLIILDGGAAPDGRATYLLFDALRNRYFRISEQTVEVLSQWRAIAPALLAARLTNSLNRNVSQNEVSMTARFLITNCLVETGGEESWQALYGQFKASRQKLWKKIVHNYLFFRIPLVRPQRFLNTAWPLVAPLFTRQAAITFVVIAVLSLYLVSRQWGRSLPRLWDSLRWKGCWFTASAWCLSKPCMSWATLSWRENTPLMFRSSGLPFSSCFQSSIPTRPAHMRSSLAANGSTSILPVFTQNWRSHRFVPCYGCFCRMDRCAPLPFPLPRFPGSPA
ncbi:hypothetical protein [Salaquimonas pukyongi]|uniref:hypothetical protein n=1 Tax=Salaquimonas pukyongi TaxID=2712698 RepID=UPI0013BE9E04|nr:hypothetical protein [Salaquimonas pukyongi]